MRTADSIIVTEQGRIVEEGTHEDLVLEGGIYASLVARQTSNESAAERNRRLVSKGADSVEEARRALEKQVRRPFLSQEPSVPSLRLVRKGS